MEEGDFLVPKGPTGKGVPLVNMATKVLLDPLDQEDLMVCGELLDS